MPLTIVDMDPGQVLSAVADRPAELSLKAGVILMRIPPPRSQYHAGACRQTRVLALRFAGNLFSAGAQLMGKLIVRWIGKDYQFGGPSIKDEKLFGVGTGMGLRKEDNELREALNKAFAEMRKDGTYDKLAKKYFDFNVYGE